MKELNNNSLAELPINVEIPNYRRDETTIGVVHFGPGAFHRAHQAYYFDKLLASDTNYAIAEIALHSTKLKQQIESQDNLYCLVQLDTEIKFRIIGAIKEVIYAPQSREKVSQLLASNNTKIVTTTITEKGYYLNASGDIDFHNEDIIHDLENIQDPKTIYGYLLAGLQLRKTLKSPPFVIIPCDNLPSNGKLFKRAIIEFARRAAPDLLDQINEIEIPSTMVDSITPATDDDLRLKVQSNIGIKDNWPICREAYAQWVIEEYEGHQAIDWARLGVTITKNLAQYERAKLRILNGAHSAIAYFGILKGYQFVDEAMRDAEIERFARALVFDEVIPLLAADFDLKSYADDVFRRFKNPQIKHKLRQIAWDGSKKLPVRILSSIAEASDQRLPIFNLAFAVACWLAFIVKMNESGEQIIDPISDRLHEIGNAVAKTNTNGRSTVEFLLHSTGIFDEALLTNPDFIGKLETAYEKAINYKEEESHEDN